jgi:hypothetical protein
MECSVHPSTSTYKTTGKQLDRFSWKMETLKSFEKMCSHLDFHLGQGSSTYSLYMKIF